MLDGWRTASTILAGVTALAGCLFPSFDGMEGASAPASDTHDIVATPRNDAGAADAGDALSAADSSMAPAPRTTQDSTTGTTSTGEGSGPRALIACGSASCDASAGEVCCVGATTTSCKAAGGSCMFTLRCDTSDQCPSGQICCGALGESRCVADSQCTFGSVLCKPSAPRCPGGRKCNDTFPLSAAMTSTTCSMF